MGTRQAWLGASVLALAAAAPGFAHAQQIASNSPFRQERWSEDWRNYHGDDAPFGAAWKDIELADHVTLSLGGDARWRAETFDAPRFGIGAETDGILTQRLSLHADLRFDDNARVFVQVGNYDGIGRQLPSTTDDDRLDITQAFLDVSHDFGGARATLRVGRQELWLGSPRFVTLRDNPNLRQRHDLARVFVDGGAWSADLFAGRPTLDHPGVFDDEADHAQEFFGGRFGVKIGGVTADALYYDLDRESFTIGGATANDRRVSIGARIAGKRGPMDFDGEFLTQSGDFGAMDVEAWGAFLDVGLRAPQLPWSPRFGAHLSYGTGDKTPFDAHQETFAPPFPRTAWFGSAGLVSFSNTIEAAGTVTLNPRDDFSLDLKASSLWRAEAGDFLYVGTQTALPGTRIADTYTGWSLSVVANWRVNANMSLVSAATQVRASDALRATGASDVTYVNAIAVFRF